MRGSQIFQQNRALGYVSNHVPANVRYIEKRKENVIVTCVGKSFHTYGCNSFRLIRVSGLHPEPIRCITSDGFLTYTACGNLIYGWKSSIELLKVYTGHEKNVHLLLPFGKHLISVDEGSLLKIWHVVTEDVYLEIPFQSDKFKISAIMHPASYKNKILLGSSQGGLQLWNIKDSKLVHTFNSMDSSVVILEQAPALDVAAIGLQDGRIVILNLKFDEIIMEFTQDWGPITGISFRTDGHPIMATGSTNGQVVFWNLEERVIVSTIRAHRDSVTTLKCLPNEPLLLTTSPDNSMKLWIFDMPDGGARLLKFREGHSAPPLCIRYHGANGKHILSSGEDSSLRVFSTINETFNRNMGIASYNRKQSKKRKNKSEEDPLKMPPITIFTSETTRDKEWDSIAAVHSGVIQVTSWSFNKCKMGEQKLIPEKYKNSNRTDFTATATTLCLSHCGNFVTIGYSSGDVVRFNIQSGIERAEYGNPAHKNAIRGIVSDNLNQILVTGAGDGLVKFWNFKNNVSKPITILNLEEGITLFRGHRESAMICVALDDFAVYIIDSDTRAIVRKFAGHNGSVTDACFSPDSRWLITAASDCVIKVWDIPSSYLIDQFKMPQVCISLSMSPTGDFLATSHVDYQGIYLWANKTLFSHINLRTLKPESEAPMMDLPSTVCEGSRIDKDGEKMDVDNDDDDVFGDSLQTIYDSPGQLNNELVTMSTLAASRWQNLLNLDIIKKRNKPKEAPKKPKSAPFFLPTVAGLDFQFDLANVNEEDENSKIIKPAHIESLTEFGKCLKESIKTKEFSNCIEKLMSLGPSMIDYEIKNLTPLEESTGSISIMLQFLKMIVHMFNINLYFELAQSYLCVFLKFHGRTLVDNAELRDYLGEIEVAQNKGWNLLEDKLLYGLGVVSSLRNFTM